MLRWLIRTGASVSKKNKCISASDASSRAAKEAVRKFDYAKRERDMQKQINYLAEGMSKLAEAVEKKSNTIGSPLTVNKKLMVADTTKAIT